MIKVSEVLQEVSKRHSSVIEITLFCVSEHRTRCIPESWWN